MNVRASDGANPGSDQLRASSLLSSLPVGAGMIPVAVVTIIPYPLARRLCVIATDANAREITLLMATPDDTEAKAEIESLTGRLVVSVQASAAEIGDRLDRLSGTLDNEDLWLQQRHIRSVSRLVDHAVNVGQTSTVRPLIDRALEFAPYSGELWLLRARVAGQRKDVIHALTVASQTAPNDRRVLRWIQSLQELEGDEPEDSMPPPQHYAGHTAGEVENQPRSLVLVPTSETQDAESIEVDPPAQHPSALPPASRSMATNDAAVEIAAAEDLTALVKVTAELIQELSGASSATVFLLDGEMWTGWSTSPYLQGHLAEALPKSNRLAAQALDQGLPIVITDTAMRPKDVGDLVQSAGIRSFALLPIVTRSSRGGLAYLNFDEPFRAGVIFEGEIARQAEVVLNCAGAAAVALGGTTSPGIARDPAFDPHTGAYSFEQFERLFHAEVERAKRYQFSVSLLSIDVDDFGLIRDASAGASADEAIGRLAASIRSIQRLSDVLARRGPDEFILMLPQTTAAGGEKAALRIHECLAESVEGSDTPLTVSIGVAAYPEQAEDAEALLNAADIALFAAKAHGKNRVALADTLSMAT